ncbi:MAG: hypothetical protein B1H04_02515 [Planctomycetales bacterium 4484_123]|nr:MAG: hypothetical protein B1H04_02515 [Planctomycetales bacterium 4484_123]
MLRLLPIALVLLPALSRGAGLTASLEVAERQKAAWRPYATARLSVVNATARPVETVVLRPAGGGPAVRMALSLPPRQAGRLELPLPAIWPVQSYELTAEDAAGEVLGAAVVGITWPEEHLATTEFIDDAYLPWRDVRAAWPGRVRWNAAVLLGLFVVAAAAALFVPGRWARAGTVLVLAAGAAALMAASAGWSDDVLRTQYTLVRYVAGAPPRVESFLVLAARRSSRVSLLAGRVPYPVYPDRASAGRDDSVVEPTDRRITLALRPGEVRIVRPGRRPYRPAPGVAGHVRHHSPGRLGIVADMDHRRALVIFEDRCWPVPAGTGRLEMLAEADQARPVAFNPAFFDRHAWRLLEYWRARYLRPGRAYLVNFTAAAGSHRMEVLELAEAGGPESAPGTRRAHSAGGISHRPAGRAP